MYATDTEPVGSDGCLGRLGKWEHMTGGQKLSVRESCLCIGQGVCICEETEHTHSCRQGPLAV